MTPPKICRAMLPRPPYITAANDTQDQNSTADSELPVSDTSTETESNADCIPFHGPYNIHYRTIHPQLFREQYRGTLRI